MKKKGVSPVISTVLLIMVVIVIALIILLWYGNFLGEAVLKFDKPIESACDDVSIRAFRGTDNKVGIDNIGNVPIYSVNILEVRGGDTTITNIPKDNGGRVSPGLTTVFSYTYPLDADSITIIPILKGRTESGGVRTFECPEDAGMEL